ncbi:MAG: hypothetical protein OEV91_04295 [Desulfobulbaceae bacterium]|nr:hypothetical protein [Desulfobulbaceae bacterium]
MEEKEKKNIRPGWLAMLQSSMAAVAFAEANEPEMAREILTNGATTDAVLFVIQDGHLHQRAVQYAVNLCHRMGCGLAVLHVFSQPATVEESATGVPGILGEMSGMPTSLFTAQGELAKTVRHFLDEHRHIVSVVVDGSTMEQSNSKRRPAKQRKWWQELNCPVVFIPAT